MILDLEPGESLGIVKPKFRSILTLCIAHQRMSWTTTQTSRIWSSRPLRCFTVWSTRATSWRTAAYHRWLKSTKPATLVFVLAFTARTSLCCPWVCLMCPERRWLRATVPSAWTCTRPSRLATTTQMVHILALVSLICSSWSTRSIARSVPRTRSSHGESVVQGQREISSGLVVYRFSLRSLLVAVYTALRFIP